MDNKKILVCDDDEGILELLIFILEDYGFNVIPEQNSLNIWDVIDRTQPDLLLLDMWMPVLTGDEIVKKIKSSASLKNLPVIMLSASIKGEMIARHAGADDFVSKPFEVDYLIQKITEILKRKGHN